MDRVNFDAVIEQAITKVTVERKMVESLQAEDKQLSPRPRDEGRFIRRAVESEPIQ